MSGLPKTKFWYDHVLLGKKFDEYVARVKIEGVNGISEKFVSKRIFNRGNVVLMEWFLPDFKIEGDKKDDLKGKNG